MIELVSLIAVCVLVARVAELEGYSQVIWVCITLVMALVTEALIPCAPLVNLLLAGVATYGLMFVYKLLHKPRLS